MPAFTDLLAARDVVLSDGATGTNYQEMGIEPGVAPEEWVFDAPDRVSEVHRRFAQAGSDLVLTCSFGASEPRLADGPLAGRAREVNRRAAEIARDAVGSDRLVGGSIGPTGQLPEPLGPLTRAAAVASFTQQARALLEGGVDLLVLETFFALDEARWALEGIQAVSDGLPVVVSFSFDQGTRTMMGTTPAEVVAAFVPLGVAAVGANCGRSLNDTDAVVQELLEVATVPVWVKPNAGVPRVVGDAVVYESTAEDFAAHVAEYARQGARIVGGCCGSSPAHLKALAVAVGR